MEYLTRDHRPPDGAADARVALEEERRQQALQEEEEVRERCLNIEFFQIERRFSSSHSVGRHEQRHVDDEAQQAVVANVALRPGIMIVRLQVSRGALWTTDLTIELGTTS